MVQYVIKNRILTTQFSIQQNSEDFKGIYVSLFSQKTDFEEDAYE